MTQCRQQRERLTRDTLSGKRRLRVYYHLENAGRDRLADLLTDYREISDGIDRILTCATLLEEIDGTGSI